MAESTKKTPSKNDKLESGKAHVQSAANEVKAAAEDLKNVATEKAEEYRKAAEGKAKEYRTKAEAAVSDAKVKARTFQQDSEKYIRDNPLRAVATAFAAGLIIGLITRR